MITQLNPMIPVHTPKGDGYAFLVIDYSQEHHLHWTVALDVDGAIWTFPNKDVLFQKNFSIGRTLSKDTK